MTINFYLKAFFCEANFKRCTRKLGKRVLKLFQKVENSGYIGKIEKLLRNFCTQTIFEHFSIFILSSLAAKRQNIRYVINSISVVVPTNTLWTFLSFLNFLLEFIVSPFKLIVCSGNVE